MSAELARRSDYRRWVMAMSQALESGDEAQFGAALAGFDSVRDSQLLTGVRRVTGDLRAALDRLRVDSKLVELAQRQVPNARQRLAHVRKLTHAAAHRTLDLVQQSGPIVEATVESLVAELELALAELTRISEAGPAAAEAVADPDCSSHGPRVPGVAHGNAVNDQHDVDALLSDFGI